MQTLFTPKQSWIVFTSTETLTRRKVLTVHYHFQNCMSLCINEVDTFVNEFPIPYITVICLQPWHFTPYQAH